MSATMSPMHQQMAGNFQAMSPEQLQEAALRLRGSAQGQLAQQILARKRIMDANPGQQPAPQQPVAQMPESGPEQYALGGTLQAKGGTHISMRAAAAPKGLLATAGPGRTDNLNIHPHADSYVLPADVLSGMGEGNSLAGAKMMDLALHTGPHGTPMPNAGRSTLGVPKPAKVGGFGLRAEGGDTPEKIPIVAAGGEYVISPDKCREIGGGDIKRGHAILDKFCLHVRAQTIKDLKKLKPPVKS